MDTPSIEEHLAYCQGQLEVVRGKIDEDPI